MEKIETTVESRISITKRFGPYPFAHRQPKHKGHCSLIHGHNWYFDITFECDQLDENGFVVDFGKLDKVKEHLADKFDHTLVLNGDDPCLTHLSFYLADATGDDGLYGHLAKIVVVANCGAEGLAHHVACAITELVLKPSFPAYRERGLRVKKVVVFEDEKNSAEYINER